MIEFVSGNFFDYEADIRVNTVNCVGVMGAGAALQFKKRYPAMYEEYVRECRLGNVKIGEPHVWSKGSLFSAQPIIINLPTKNHWKKPSEYEYVEKGLYWLRQFLQNKPDKTLTLPALGCGHGGLDWEKVKDMIIKYLKDLETKILVFEPASSIKNIHSAEDIEKYVSLGIKNLIPGENDYPLKLRGKSVSEIKTMGNPEILMRKLLSIIINSKATDREKAAILACVEAIEPHNGVSILMGYNSSFEIDIVKRLVERGFAVAIVLPYGILQLKLRKDLAAIWNEQRNLVISISDMHQSWNINEGLKSLKFRIAISEAILITNFELDFVSRLEKEFNANNNTIFYLNYWNEEPTFFNNIRAHKIGRDKNTNSPNMQTVEKSLF